MEIKKQTAVEWLVEQLAYHYSSININNTVIFEDAKAMMNEQIMDAYAKGSNDRLKNIVIDYYNETYGD